MSIGLKGTLKIIYKFPPIILTPIFSIWTIGPIMPSSICGSIYNNGHQKLGVSIWFTWINLFLSLASGFVYPIVFYAGVRSGSVGPVSLFTLTFICSCLFIAIAIIFLILLQCLDNYPGCCCPCLPCCESNCYPVTQLTYLDVNNIDVIITQEEIELDQL